MTNIQQDLEQPKMEEPYPPGFSMKSIRRIEVWRKEVASASASSASTSASPSTTGASNPITPTTTVTTNSGSAKSNAPPAGATPAAGPRAGAFGGAGGAVPAIPAALASPVVDSQVVAGAITTNTSPAKDNMQANIDAGRVRNGDGPPDAEVAPTAKPRRSSSVSRFLRRIITGFKDKDKRNNNVPATAANAANEHLEGYEPTAMYDAEGEAGAGGAPTPAPGVSVCGGEPGKPNEVVDSGGPLGDGTINIDATLTDVDQAMMSSSDERTGKGLRVREERLERAKKLLEKSAATAGGSGQNVQAQK